MFVFLNAIVKHEWERQTTYYSNVKIVRSVEKRKRMFYYAIFTFQLVTTNSYSYGYYIFISIKLILRISKVKIINVLPRAKTLSWIRFFRFYQNKIFIKIHCFTLRKSKAKEGGNPKFQPPLLSEPLLGYDNQTL